MFTLADYAPELLPAAHRWARAWWAAIQHRVGEGVGVAEAAEAEAARLLEALGIDERPTVLEAWETTVLFSGDPKIGELVAWFRVLGLEPGDVIVCADLGEILEAIRKGAPTGVVDLVGEN